jgi:putative phosphoribosyl transferase
VAAAVKREAVRVGPLGLPGEWTLPARAVACVVFVHGSGSRHGSPRNRFVCGVLQHHRLATLLFDLLGADETRDRRLAFDIALLTRRLADAIDWLRQRDEQQDSVTPRRLRVGLFGASTGAAAALQVAAEQPACVSALVLRGGRTDLAPLIARVQAPTMLIAGGADTDVLQHNRLALHALRCEKRLEVVPGASHLFEEPGALDAVAHLAADWFIRHAAERVW